MRKRLLLLLAFAPLLVNAQVSTYSFASGTAPYNPLTGATELGAGDNDDNIFEALPIGFSFVYNGQAYTTFSVNTNGFIAMGDNVTSTRIGVAMVSFQDHSGLILSSDNMNASDNVISGMNLDLAANSVGTLSYALTGTAPNRTLVVEWKQYQYFDINDRTDNINFQIQLLEGTNQVVLAYGTNSFQDGTYQAQVGLRGNSNADFNSRNSNSSWAASTASTSNTGSLRVSATVAPSPRLTYTFTPGIAATRPGLNLAQVSAYPNPTAGRIVLRNLPAARIGTEATLSDASGKALRTLSLAQEMDLAALPAGLYYLSAPGLRLPVAKVQ